MAKQRARRGTSPTRSPEDPSESAAEDTGRPLGHHTVAVMGSGFGGLALGKHLRDAGIEDFVLLERADEVGGTWRDNTYPGCACDVASNLYSLSFAQNPDWSLTHSPQPEILEYLKGVARTFGLYPKVRFGHEVLKARWDERGVWVVETSKGTITCNVFVSATGPFGSPRIPDFEGLATYEGARFHTARWDHSVDLRGKRVAVIGTGATAIQVVPEVQKLASKLVVFQRTPSHIIPRVDIPTSPLKRAAMRHLPFLQQSIRSIWYAAYELFIGTSQFVDTRFLQMFEAAAKAHIAVAVKDPVLRQKVTPSYKFMCKRPVFNTTFYPAIQQPNVELVTDGVKSFRPTGIVDGTGRLHEVDVVVFATGFHTPNDSYQRIFDAHGTSVADTWQGIPTAYMGTSIAGFPNLFVMLGPFSAAGNQSAVFMLESQAHYITDAVRKLERAGLPAIDVKPEIERAFYADVQERSKDTSWVSGGCTSYFQAADGGNVGLWPSWSFVYRWKTRDFDLSKFNVRRASPTEASP